jgi:prepilin-type N-terminal cleavage/methylation domain-containing protein/prepilin-type processing-associated H-X9-DG protein
MSEQKAIPHRAFTLVELLVVIAVIGILTALLLPVISRGKLTALSVGCLNNLRQLQLAYHGYSNDELDRLASNAADRTESTSGAWVKGNVQRYTSNYGKDITEGVFFPQIKSVQIYRCPGSQAFVHNEIGTPVPHNRSYSMSVWLGSNVKLRGPKRAGSVRTPSSVFVFIDENSISIDNGTFGIHERAKADNYWNLPSNRHLRGGNLTFFDGHAEHWRWTGPYLNRHNDKFSANDTRTQRPDPEVNPTNLSLSSRTDPDLIRLSSAVPAP